MVGTLFVDAPPSLSATVVSGGAVDLQWQAPAAAASRGLTYVVSRRTSGAGAFTEIARTSALAITDHPGSGTFDYAVRAAISAFTSADSVVAGISTTL